MSLNNPVHLANSFTWFDDPVGAKGRVEDILITWENNLLFAKSTVPVVANKVVQILKDNDETVATTARDAYSALRMVVTTLLGVPKGNARLGREDQSIMKCLDTAIAQFEGLSNVAHINLKGLGLQAGDCTELRDKVLLMRDIVNEDAAQLILDAVAAWREGSTRSDTWVRLRDNEGDCRRRLESAQEDFDTADNWFSGAFTSSSEVNSRRQTRDHLQTLLNDNNRDRDIAFAKKAEYWSLASKIKIASAVLTEMSCQLDTVAAQIQEEFAKVGTSQMAASKLWDGFMELKNEIWATDFHSTRDKSLHKVLDLLKADDEVFMLQDWIEQTEVDIKKDIADRLGQEKLALLIVSGNEPSIPGAANEIEL